MRPSRCGPILVLFSVFFLRDSATGLQDVTADLFGSENRGTVSAFGDFNSDKQTDLFIIREREYCRLTAKANTHQYCDQTDLFCGPFSSKRIIISNESTVHLPVSIRLTRTRAAAPGLSPFTSVLCVVIVMPVSTLKSPCHHFSSLEILFQTAHSRVHAAHLYKINYKQHIHSIRP